MKKKLTGLAVALALIAGVFAATTAADVAKPETAAAYITCGNPMFSNDPVISFGSVLGTTFCNTGNVYGITETCVEWYVSVFGGPYGWGNAYWGGGYNCSDLNTLADAADPLCPNGPNGFSAPYRTVTKRLGGVVTPSKAVYFQCVNGHF